MIAGQAKGCPKLPKTVILPWPISPALARLADYLAYWNVTECGLLPLAVIRITSSLPYCLLDRHFCCPKQPETNGVTPLLLAILTRIHFSSRYRCCSECILGFYLPTIFTPFCLYPPSSHRIRVHCATSASHRSDSVAHIPVPNSRAALFPALYNLVIQQHPS